MRNQRGFTLIEVLVAAAVLGIAASALFGLLSQSLFNLRKTEDVHHYQLAAQGMANRVLLLSDLPVEGHVEGALDDAGGRWTVDITPWAPTKFDKKPEEAVFKVKVAVTWPGRSTRRSIDIETLKSAKVVDSTYDLQKALEDVFPR